MIVGWIQTSIPLNFIIDILTSHFTTKKELWFLIPSPLSMEFHFYLSMFHCSILPVARLFHSTSFYPCLECSPFTSFESDSHELAPHIFHFKLTHRLCCTAHATHECRWKRCVLILEHALLQTQSDELTLTGGSGDVWHSSNGTRTSRLFSPLWLLDAICTAVSGCSVTKTDS